MTTIRQTDPWSVGLSAVRLRRFELSALGTYFHEQTARFMVPGCCLLTVFR